MTEEAKRQAAAAMAGLPAWQQEAAMAVPSSLVREIINDNRGQPTKAAAAPSAAKGTGWVEPRPLETRPAFELGLIDRLCEKFIGGANNIK